MTQDFILGYFHPLPPGRANNSWTGTMTILTIVISVAIFGAVFGWFSDRSKEIKEDKFNRDLRIKLDQRERALNEREQFINKLPGQFESGLLNGRKWLAHFISEAERALDESIAHRLHYKSRPAPKAAQEVLEARAERRVFKERAKFLEFQLLSYKEYFPFLEEYEEMILDESIPLSGNENNLEALEDADPVLKYVPKADFEKLSIRERNQLALDRYLRSNLSQSAIGRLYERFLGYQFESNGWNVDYFGILKGYEDLGRDLICKKDGKTLIVQAKCWAAEKLIHEKHIFQLFGTTQLYLMNNSGQGLFPPDVRAIFVTTTSLSSVARKAAEWLKIELREHVPLDKTYPMIKCNINQATKEKIYHLPFDQQYDRTKIVPTLGELYVRTVEEAESKEFRRAFRHIGPFS
jgi:hypothetical protein